MYITPVKLKNSEGKGFHANHWEVKFVKNMNSKRNGFK